ncbi:MAG TPA: VWA domain-containing protein [Pyrinomonadaceae bacterium]
MYQPRSNGASRFLLARRRVLVPVVLVLACFSMLMGQAGRRPTTTGTGGVLVNLVAKYENDSQRQITAKQIAVYDNGVEQNIKNLTPDPSPAKIVLLVDNSLTLRADIEKLEQAAREFAYEIFDGDKMLIVGYDEEAEIVADWTDDAKAIEASLKSFRKKGQPHLFDAISVVVDQALRPFAGQKRVIVAISDGLDKGSKTTFEKVLAELQSMDITVYAIQAPDRTRGAIRRDVPKPKVVVEKIVEATGGMTFSIDEPTEAAKAICDELRKHRYVLSYAPSSIPFGEVRSLLVVGNEGIMVRAKNAQQPN